VDSWVDFFADFSEVLFAHLISPDKRLHVAYLTSAALLALWVFRREGQTRSFFSYLFDVRVWWSSSAQVDYQLIVFNSVVKVLLFGQWLAFGLHIAFWLEEFLRAQLGPASLSLGAGELIIVYTLSLTLLGDLSVYLVHRMMHAIPLLWRFHSVHHSATTMTPLTLLRLHPVELVINTCRRVCISGLLAGFFGYLSRHQVSPMTFFGVNVATLFFFAFGANLRHSHIPLSYWPIVEHILISPRQHQIHHSVDPAHHHANFASKFALWDWLFRTLRTSRECRADLRFGLGNSEEGHSSLKAALLGPLGLQNSDQSGAD